MTELNVEVIGTEPPCARCASLKKAVESAASTLKESGLVISISKLNILSKEVTSKYGVLVSPALAVNGVVKIIGRVPSANEIVSILKASARIH